MADGCSPDFRYEGSKGAMLAYCRSKLGCLWLASELQRHSPELHVVTVHPGVVLSGLMGEVGRAMHATMRSFMLDAVTGAQTSLYCATQADVPAGAYVHNCLGRMELSQDDPASDALKAAELWRRCDRLVASYL
jgi:NAD(P)-dependent dehydrogenase (short-subunit alcohol dehydrogenase family)